MTVGRNLKVAGRPRKARLGEGRGEIVRYRANAGEGFKRKESAMLRDLIQLAPVCITFVAAVLLTKSSLELKVENIAWMVQNTLSLMENLSHQKADATVGSVLLFAALIWQMVNLTEAVAIQSFAGIAYWSVLIALLLTGLLLWLCWCISKRYGRNIYSNARERIRKG